jgi:hypothetical protein
MEHVCSRGLFPSDVTFPHLQVVPVSCVSLLQFPQALQQPHPMWSGNTDEASGPGQPWDPAGHLACLISLASVNGSGMNLGQNPFKHHPPHDFHMTISLHSMGIAALMKGSFWNFLTSEGEPTSRQDQRGRKMNQEAESWHCLSTWMEHDLMLQAKTVLRINVFLLPLNRFRVGILSSESGCLCLTCTYIQHQVIREVPKSTKRNSKLPLIPEFSVHTPQRQALLTVSHVSKTCLCTCKHTKF